jgi:hypothetical protein
MERCSWFRLSRSQEKAKWALTESKTVDCVGVGETDLLLLITFPPTMQQYNHCPATSRHISRNHQLSGQVKKSSLHLLPDIRARLLCYLF